MGCRSGIEIALFVSLAVTGCLDGGNDLGPADEFPGPFPGDSLVFASRQARQCESDGISVDASAQILIDAGIDVIQSTCGYRTDLAYIAACGGGTGDILIHEIRTINLADAEALGFQDIAVLVDDAGDPAYSIINCMERAPVPTGN